MKQFYLKTIVLVCCLFSVMGVFAQNKKLSGTVTAEDDGQGIPSVSISIKGTKSGTQTDMNGKFIIEANPNDVLVFTYVGYLTQEQKVGNNTNLKVVMKPAAANLDEIVVVGYGTQNRRTVTNSIAKLDKEVLANAPRANVGSALQGTIAGVQAISKSGQPGVGPTVFLRGGASINSPGTPLVIVDGVIRDYNDIASENIQSMEILKDAASTAIYGARANNGVILITTKTGAAGAAQINYKFTGGYNVRRDGYTYLGAKDYIYYTRLGYLNSGKPVGDANNARGLGLINDAANLASFDIRKYVDGTTVLPTGWGIVDDPYGGQLMYKDHGGEIENLVFRNTYTKDHYVSATGGNDKGKFFAAFDSYNEDGVIVGSSYKRYTADLNGSYKVRPNIEIAGGTTLSTSSQLGTIGGEVNSLYRSLAIWPTFNPWLDEAKTAPNPGNSASDGNPLYWLSRLKRQNEVNKVVINGSIKWDLLPGLYFKGTANAYLLDRKDESFQKSTQTYANIFANPQSIGSASRDAILLSRRDFQTQFNGILNYNKSLDLHNFTAMVGAETFQVKTFNSQLYGQNAPTDEIPTINASTVFPATVNGAKANYSEKSVYRINSFFGRFAYDFDQKYLFTAVLRADGASSLPDQHKWGYFPGVSAGWNVQKEKFYVNAGVDKYVSTLKPRVSYGVNGNIAGLGRYEVQGVYTSPPNYDGAGGFYHDKLANQDLRWERSKTLGAGLDLGLLQDRVTLLFDYYDRRTSDLLTPLLFPDYVGYPPIQTNSGTLQNKGYEFAVNAKVLNTAGGFTLSLGANASFVKNKVLKLPYNGNENNRQGGLQVYDAKTGQLKWVGGIQEGQTIGDIYGFKQVSIFKDDAEVQRIAGNRKDMIANVNGPNLPKGTAPGTGRITPGDVNWLDVNGDDIIDSRDQVYLGNMAPKWTGGFNANANYKGFNLYTRFEFALGHTVYNDLLARTLGNYQGTFNYTDLITKAWSPDNTVTDIPKVYFADQVQGSKQNYTRANNAGAVVNGNNSLLYEKGDYLALRELTLSYTLPKSLMAKTKFLANSRIYATGSNLFYITKFTGSSPEAPLDANNKLTGVYLGAYPTARSFVLGLEVSF
ncbi:SusC/RagA family TonB-linked outer membrane protein [Pedobacter gandavensis]|uniref:SusC/RagA family TonB-linked outer membrane protein n=1 Tax=Pedobacter gandavensis TaxID=2679963 RepID=A0ABR6ER93_9SPHI|nr:SusC/RagA family TonB-linked outer membrane protein [Pedobacter gandavensis]MBB2147775.1 SusC/RagA family TonB-linked outer membrane protein [Pedobacter gandavensis]